MKTSFTVILCRILIIVGGAALFPATILGHGNHNPERIGTMDLGVEEKTGKKVNLDAVFHDENGAAITMKRAITRPTLLLPVFYRCTESCGMMLGNLSTALNDVSLAPGRDYGVLSFSIDEEDTPALALGSKKNYGRLLRKEFPAGSWRFLTGTKENIRLFTDSAGFKFRKTGHHTFIHPNVLIVLSKDGTVIRYLYGPYFLPFDVAMALTEADRGTPSLSIRKLASYCFTYDKERKGYSFTAVRYVIAGVIILLGILLFFILRKRGSR